MTLLEYRIFHTVTQQGSFARAAQILHLTPSAISHAVSSMEESCGFSLFVRGKGGVSLTRSGEALYPVIRQVLSADEALTQTVGELKGVQRGKVRIGAFNSVCVAWLPQLVAEYRVKYPGVEIEIDQGTYDDVIEWIKTGVVDLGFLSTESTRDLAVRPLYRDRLMCVAPRGFKTKTPGVIMPEEMRAETFVVQGDATDADVQAFLAKYRITVRATCRVVDDLSTIAMVESGFGICIMPSLTRVWHCGAQSADDGPCGSADGDVYRVLCPAEAARGAGDERRIRSGKHVLTEAAPGCGTDCDKIVNRA